MACTNAVDIQLFHQPEILLDAFAAHGPSRKRIVFMTIHSPDHQRLTIKKQLGIPDLKFPEPDLLFQDLQGIPGLVFKTEDQPVQVRPFIRPE